MAEAAGDVGRVRARVDALRRGRSAEARLGAYGQRGGVERRELKRWGGRAGWIVLGPALLGLVIGICVASIPGEDEFQNPDYEPLPSTSASP